MFDLSLDIPLVAAVYLVTIQRLQAALLLLMLAIRSVARPTHHPASPVAAAIPCQKIHLGKAAGLAAAEDMPYIVGLEPFGILLPPYLGLEFTVGA